MRGLPVNLYLIAAFERLLCEPAVPGRQKEQELQDFLERHTELIPTPNLLNHHLHFEAVVSKFPLGTELTTDYVYITKSSDTWRITLVELEAPDKHLFTSDLKKATPSSEFNAALNQVRRWKDFIDDNPGEVTRRLEPLLQPQQQNPIEFHYLLIIGRSENKNASRERQKLFRRLSRESGIEVLTYDQLLSWYRNGERYTKLVLRLAGFQYAFKYMHLFPTQILAYVGPDRLAISANDRARLVAAGYEMDKWSQGEPLMYNIKLARSTLEQDIRDGTIFNRQDPSI